MDFAQIIEIGKGVYAFLEEAGVITFIMENVPKILSKIVEAIFSLI